jgi:2-octaprenylphenol hydroxylase
MRAPGTGSVLIVGAGPVGLCLAALLATASDALDITRLDARAAPQRHTGTAGLRVYALSRASQRILHTLESWSPLAPVAGPYRRMRVWCGKEIQRAACLNLDAADIGEPDLGHIVEDGDLRVAVAAQLGSRANVELMFGAALERIDIDDRTVRVRTSAGREHRAQVLIAADGTASTARALLELPVVEGAYDQSAVVGHVTSEQLHAHTAWQRFLPGGPVALLPLANGLSSVVWSTTPPRAEQLTAASDRQFAAELTQATGGVLGALEAASARARFPLRLLHAPRYCRARVALVGDAAHTVHPLAGQGLNLGMLDAAVLAEVLLRAFREGQDPGDLRVLREYELARKAENLKMMAALDSIHRVFRFSEPAGAVALSMANALPPLRNALMRHALGMAGAAAKVAAAARAA